MRIADVIGSRATVFNQIILTIAVVISTACSVNPESSKGVKGGGGPEHSISTYINLLDLEDYQRFSWSGSAHEGHRIINQSSESDVMHLLAQCEALPGEVCIELQPGFLFRMPCDEGVLSNVEPKSHGKFGLVARRSSPYGDFDEYILELRAEPNRMRVGYVYSVGLTFFLYLEEEVIQDEDGVFGLPKSNTVYVAYDNPLDPVRVICAT